LDILSKIGRLLLRWPPFKLKGYQERKRFQDIIYRVLNKENTAFLPIHFYFIREEIKRQFKCFVYPEIFTPIRRVAIINKKDYYVLIDCGAGIRDNLEIDEYCGKLYKFIFSTKLNKNFVYFKVNYSPTKSKNIVKMAAEHGGIVKQCMPWSIYIKVYPYFFRNRFSLRKKVLKTPKKYDIVFFGKLGDSYYYPAPYIDERFKYPISVYEAEYFYKNYVASEYLKKYFLLKPPRKEYWEELILDSDYKIRTAFSHHVPFSVYLNNILRTNFNFCPPGIGQIIHKIYDNMAIGIPSIIPESSYKLAPPIDINDVGIVYRGKKDFTNKYLDFMEENKFREVHEKCIRIYDKYLTPEAIVTDMIKKIKDIF